MDETLIPDSVADRRRQSGVPIESIEGGNELPLHGSNDRASADKGSTASPKGDPTVKRETRSLSQGPMKAIREEDDESDHEDDASGPSIDLTKELPASLFAKPATRMPTLKANNYHVWAQAHERLFKSRGMMGWVEGYIPKPETRRAATRWRQVNTWIVMVIVNSVEDVQTTHLKHIVGAREAWDELKRLHGVSGKGRLLTMFTRFISYQKSADQTVDAMAADLRMKRDQIMDVRPELVLTDEVLALVLVNACRGPEYDMAKYVLGRGDVPTPQQVITELRSVEQDKSAKDAALAARKGRGNRPGMAGRTESGGQRDYSSYQCHNCGQYGHLKADCKNPPKPATTDTGNQATSEAQKGKKDGKGKQHEHAKTADETGHVSDDSVSDSSVHDSAWMARSRTGNESDNENPPHYSALMARTRYPVKSQRPKETADSRKWLIDSGATRHMTPHRDWFVDMKPHRGVVEFGNDDELPTAGRGTIRVAFAGRMQTMQDVLYVPGMGCNLLSIVALDRKGFETRFKDQGVKIINTATNAVVARGGVYNGLYQLMESTSDRAFVTGDTPPNNVSEATKEEKDASVFRRLHERLGHPGAHRLKDLHLFVEGVEVVTSPPHFQCDVCDQSKMSQTINRGPHAKETRPGARMQADFWGPYPTGSIVHGCRWFGSVIDEATDYSAVEPIPDKKGVGKFLLGVVLTVDKESTRDRKDPSTTPVVVVRTDNAQEYLAVKDELKLHGITLETTSTYTHYQIGIAERFNRTIGNIMRTMLSQSGLPMSFWSEACLYGNHLRNRLPHGPRGSTTAYEKKHLKKPDLSKERIFGCVCLVYIPKDVRKSKLHPRGYEAIYLGYLSSSQYRVYDPRKNRVVFPTSVKFYEDRKGVDLLNQLDFPQSFNTLRAGVDPLPPRVIDSPRDALPSVSDDTSSDDDDSDGVMGPEASTSSPSGNLQNKDFGDPEAEGELSTRSPPTAANMGESTPNSAGAVMPPASGPGEVGELSPSNIDNIPPGIESPHDTDNVSTGPSVPLLPTPATVRRSTRQPTPATATSSRPQRRKKEYDPHTFYKRFGERAQLATAILEPQTYHEAITGPHARWWKLAIAKQLHDLMAAGTWILVDLPLGKRPITCKWVFKVKYNPDGTVDKFKARLVARGFSQAANIDFHETFAPTMRFESLRMLFAFCNKHGIPIEQMDVDNAYLNTLLKEVIYMWQPQGSPETNASRGKVLQLVKGLYGLKQSARLWNQQFAAAIRAMGFFPSHADSCVFFRNDKDGMAIIGLYVDDILIATKDPMAMRAIKKGIHDAFKCTEAGPVNRILGIQSHRDWKANTVILEQSQYAEKILRDYDMDQAVPVSTPIDGYTSLAPSQPDETRACQQDYQKRIGSLMYLMTCTRPDLAFAVSKLSQFCTDPTVRHMNALNRVLRYLRGTTHYGLRYQATGDPVGYADSAYGDNKEDRKSTYGFSLLCGQAACIWYSHKQRDVTTSTTEAEYVSLTEAGKTIVWATKWMKGLRFMPANGDPITLFGDNKGSNALTANPEHHSRTKHIDIKYHYIRQLVDDKDVSIQYIPTAEMAADILTKPLATNAFERGRQLLGMYDCSCKYNKSPSTSETVRR